ncbi:MAG: transposase [Planctomycetes bacterium]|nr:transposase [Planctomycetota bacterium]
MILDNYRIHTNRLVQMAMQTLSGRIVLHFLPPYCQNENKIERLWLDLHSQVTRNHRYPTMEALMNQVWYFLKVSARCQKIRICHHAA